MARKPKTSNIAAEGELGLSDLHIRLNLLRKENEKLLKQIETARTNLNRLNQSIEEVGIAIAQRVAPYRQKILELDHQIHQLFKEILFGRKFGKKSRKNIESFYYHLQADGLISPQRLHTDPDVIDPDVFKADNSREWEGDRGQPQLEELVKPDREELKKIRHLFLRLAENFHPDKVTDAAEREYRTEIMKEINLAYQNADLARLRAIEKQHQLEGAIDLENCDDLSDRCTQVESENAFLNEQLATLKQQLKLTKKTQQGEITAVIKKITKYGGDPIGEALSEFEVQIGLAEELCKFVTDFRDRRITIQEFLQGRKAQAQYDMSEEELMLEFLSQLQ
jgi:hypothetical protein